MIQRLKTLDINFLSKTSGLNAGCFVYKYIYGTTSSAMNILHVDKQMMFTGKKNDFFFYINTRSFCGKKSVLM